MRDEAENGNAHHALLVWIRRGLLLFPFAEDCDCSRSTTSNRTLELLVCCSVGKRGWCMVYGFDYSLLLLDALVAALARAEI